MTKKKTQTRPAATPATQKTQAKPAATPATQTKKPNREIRRSLTWEVEEFEFVFKELGLTVLAGMSPGENSKEFMRRMWAEVTKTRTYQRLLARTGKKAKDETYYAGEPLSLEIAEIERLFHTHFPGKVEAFPWTPLQEKARQNLAAATPAADATGLAYVHERLADLAAEIAAMRAAVAKILLFSERASLRAKVLCEHAEIVPPNPPKRVN